MYNPLNLTLDLYLQRMVAKGEFDDLAGQGEPIADLQAPAQSVLDKLMAEADVKPVPVMLHQKIAKIRERLAAASDPSERKSIMKELADAQTRLAIEIEAYNK